MAHVPLRPIGGPRERALDEAEFAANRARMAEREAVLAARRAEVAAGWGPKYAERVRKKGKLTARERIERLADPGAPRLEVGTFVNYGETFGELTSPGAGVITLFTRVEGRWAVVIANDNTVASGSWWPRTPEKIQRAQEMALRLRLPVIYLVDCSGLYLPEQRRTFSGATGAGHIFEMNAELSAAGVPQVAGVFGDCIAGGGYMPIISDRVIMTERAYMVIAGAALIKGAKSQRITSLDIGGPEVHVHQSGVADARVPDDEAAIAAIRRELARLPAPAADYYRGGVAPAPPRFDPAELAGLVPVDHRVAYDPREVLARLVDGSLFWELWPHQGREVVVGVGRVGGLYAAFAINDPRLVPGARGGRPRPGGILYRDGIAKLSALARACDSDGIPLIWLQDISGFDIGEEAERLGLLGWGSSLIYANSTQRAPVYTVLLRRASGAGYYAMSGRPYHPVVQLSTPVSRLSVMEGRTLAIASYRTKLDDEFEVKSDDPAERAKILAGMREVEERIEADMDPYVSARQLDTDEIVGLGELRPSLEVLVELAYASTGYRTVKNPRIWSLHDLEALAAGPRAEALEALACGVAPAAEGEPVLLTSPAVGVLDELRPEGALLGPGATVGRLERAAGLARLVVPEGAQGVVHRLEARAGDGVAFGAPLLTLAPLAGAALAPQRSEQGADEEGRPLVRAPQVGRFYHRPGPDQAPYVKAGDLIEAGKTLGMIEVMKTFFQVRFGDPTLGAGLPARARVVRYLVEDGGEVAEGQPLLELEPL